MSESARAYLDNMYAFNPYLSDSHLLILLLVCARSLARLFCLLKRTQDDLSQSCCYCYGTAAALLSLSSAPFYSVPFYLVLFCSVLFVNFFLAPANVIRIPCGLSLLIILNPRAEIRYTQWVCVRVCCTSHCATNPQQHSVECVVGTGKGVAKDEEQKEKEKENISSEPHIRAHLQNVSI